VFPAPVPPQAVRRRLLPLQFIGQLREAAPTSCRHQMQRLVHDIIAAAFSNQMITPGTTSHRRVDATAVNDLGLGTCQPSVTVQRRGVEMGDSAVLITPERTCRTPTQYIRAEFEHRHAARMGRVLLPG